MKKPSEEVRNWVAGILEEDLDYMSVVEESGEDATEEELEEFYAAIWREKRALARAYSLGALDERLEEFR